MTTPTTPLTLGFLMFPGFPMACLTSAIEPLRAANEIEGRRVFAWTLIAETAGPVRSSAEVRFDADRPLAASGPLDHLFLLAPPTARFETRAGAAALRRLDRAGATLGGFSGGVFPLARAGVMQGRRCSVHWLYEAAFTAEFAGIETSRSAIVRDGRRITASGAGAVFDLMLRLIGERLGADRMTEVACWFQHPFMRDESASQTMPTIGAGCAEPLLPAPVRKAITLFAEHLDDPLAVAQAAQAAAVSERHLVRLFSDNLGMSPLRYYRLMRLNRARQRVLYSRDALGEIAAAVGYSSASMFARYYRDAYGVTPGEDRRRAARPAGRAAASEGGAGGGLDGVQERSR